MVSGSKCVRSCSGCLLRTRNFRFHSFQFLVYGASFLRKLHNFKPGIALFSH